MTDKKSRAFYSLFWGIVFADQLTKWWASNFLTTPIVIIPNWLAFVLKVNYGSAWSLFYGYSFILGVIGVLILLVAYFFRKKLPLNRYPFCFGLLFAGILGNTIDRLRLGYVVDFIDVNLQFYHWPTFNIADSALCLSVAFLFFVWR